MDVKRTLTTLLRDGLILVFNQDKLDVVRTAEALNKAGLNNMEVTCRIARPLEKIARLRREMPEFVVGAASLIDFPEMLQRYNRVHSDDPLPSVEQAVEAGVDFLVSAGNFRQESYDRFAGKVTMIAGCGSVSEILAEFSKGANLCKLFPARQLGGAAFVKAIDPAIHKTISIVPTGGTNCDNIPQYIDAGVLVVGGSFSMIQKDAVKTIIERQDYDLLSERLAEVKRLIDSRRAEKWTGLDFASASLEEISSTTARDFNLKLFVG